MYTNLPSSLEDSLPCPPANPLCSSLISCPCAWQGQREAEVPQGKLFQFHVTPVLSKDLFFVDSEPLPCPGATADDLAPLTEVPVLGSKPVLWLLQAGPARPFALGVLLGGWCCSTSPSPLNALFQAMESEVSAAFDNGGPEDILSRAFKLTVTREDICTLQPLGWLNDRVLTCTCWEIPPPWAQGSSRSSTAEPRNSCALLISGAVCGLVFLEALSGTMQLPGVSLGDWSGCGGFSHQHKSPGGKFWEQKLPAAVLPARGWPAKTCCCLVNLVSYFTSQFASLSAPDHEFLHGSSGGKKQEGRISSGLCF